MIKKIVYIFYFLSLFIILNVLSFGFIYFKTDFNMYKIEFQEFKKRFSKNEEKFIYPHPYYGYGGYSLFPLKNSLGNNDEPIFFKIPKKIYSDDINILILGGSVAAHLSLNDSEDKFKINNKIYDKHDIFEKTINWKFNTDRFKIYNAAIPGGKQPQQLFKLNYLLLNGYKFDYVINLDGFNEIALSISENIPIKNNIIYPRQYSRQIRAFNKDISCVKNSNKSIHNTSILPIRELYNLYNIYSCHKKLYGLQTDIDEDFPKLSKFKNENFEIKLNKIIKLWENSSNMIFNLSEVYNFNYIHILQPNQYYKNSKNLTDSEKEISNFQKYKNPIEKFYENLNLNNLTIINKFDARKIFISNRESLYRDYCCHLNNKGMFILSNKIINEFQELFETEITK